MWFCNSIRVDGSMFIADGNKIVYGFYLPERLVIAYCWLAEKLEREK